MKLGDFLSLYCSCTTCGKITPWCKRLGELPFNRTSDGWIYYCGLCRKGYNTNLDRPDNLLTEDPNELYNWEDYEENEEEDEEDYNNYGTD